MRFRIQLKNLQFEHLTLKHFIKKVHKKIRNFNVNFNGIKTHLNAKTIIFNLIR